MIMADSEKEKLKRRSSKYYLKFLDESSLLDENFSFNNLWNNDDNVLHNFKKYLLNQYLALKVMY